MTPRLKNLREQRDLILKHLRWIETEIASEEPTPSGPPPSPIPRTSDTTAVPEPVSGPVGEPSIAPDLLEEPKTGSLQNQVRCGCLIYFGLAWLLLAAVTGFIYLTYS